MAFKLKNINVSSTGQKASPFKISEALVHGAGVAAGGFNTLGGATQSLQSQGLGVEMEEPAASTAGATTAAAGKCADRDLDAASTERCKQIKSDEFNKGQDKLEADKLKAEEDKKKKDAENNAKFCAKGKNSENALCKKTPALDTKATEPPITT